MLNCKICMQIFHLDLVSQASWLIHQENISLTQPLVARTYVNSPIYLYSTRHVKMDSASRVSLEANFTKNASRGASRVSLWNQIPSTELKNVPHENFAKQKCLSRGFRGTHARYSRFLSSFMCHVLYTLLVVSQKDARTTECPFKT